MDLTEKIELLEEAANSLEEARQALEAAGMFQDEWFRRTVGTQLEGSNHGWLGGPFLIDEVRGALEVAQDEQDFAQEAEV
jgi:hypothetical protein